MPASVSGENRVNDSLDPTHRPERASSVVENQQPAVRSQDPFDLADRFVLVGDGGQDEQRDHGVEATVSEFQVLRIAHA